jgi:very-short-patch-repair endonuclease
VTIVGVGTVDLLIGERLIVEADGRGNHDGTSRRHKDLVRDASAAMWGYITLRFDYAMIVHDWDAVERAIIAHVEAGSHVTRAPLAQRRG